MAPASASFTLPWQFVDSCFHLKQNASVCISTKICVNSSSTPDEKHDVNITLRRESQSVTVDVYEETESLFKTGTAFHCAIDSKSLMFDQDTSSPPLSDEWSTRVILPKCDAALIRKKKPLQESPTYDPHDDSDIPDFTSPRMRTRVKSGSLKVKKFFWEKDGVNNNSKVDTQGKRKTRGSRLKSLPSKKSKVIQVGVKQELLRTDCVVDETETNSVPCDDKDVEWTPNSSSKPAKSSRRSFTSAISRKMAKKSKDTDINQVGGKAMVDGLPEAGGEEAVDAVKTENQPLKRKVSTANGQSMKMMGDTKLLMEGTNVGCPTIAVKAGCEESGVPEVLVDGKPVTTKLVSVDGHLFLTGKSTNVDSIVDGEVFTDKNEDQMLGSHDNKEAGSNDDHSEPKQGRDKCTASESIDDTNGIMGQEMVNQLNDELLSGYFKKVDGKTVFYDEASQMVIEPLEITPLQHKSLNRTKHKKSRKDQAVELGSELKPSKGGCAKKKEKIPQILWKNKKLRTVKLDAGELVSDDEDEAEDAQYPFEFAGVVIPKDATSFTKSELKAISQGLSPEKIVVAICPLCKLVLNQNMLCHMRKVHHTGPAKTFVSMSQKELVPKLESILKQLGEKNIAVDICCPFCEENAMNKYVSESILTHLNKKHSGELEADTHFTKLVLCRMIRTKRDEMQVQEDKRMRRLRYICGSHQVFCPFCTKLISRQAVSHHINTFCSGNLMRGDHFHCKECMHVSITESNFLEHYEKHHANKAYVCQYCARTFTRKQQFFSHLRHKHRHGKNIPLEPIHCTAPDCKYKTFLPVRMKQHHQRMHAQADNQFRCEYCEEAFMLRETLAKHLYLAHQEMRKHTCPACCRIFLDLQAYQRHTTACLQLNSPQSQIAFKKTAGRAVRKVFTGQDHPEGDATEQQEEERFLQHLEMEEIKNLKKEAGKRTRKRKHDRGEYLPHVSIHKSDLEIAEAGDGVRLGDVRTQGTGEVHVELQQVEAGVGLEHLILDSTGEQHPGEQYVYIMQGDAASGTSYVIQARDNSLNHLASQQSLLVTGDATATEPQPVIPQEMLIPKDNTHLLNLSEEQLKDIPPGTEIVVYMDNKEGESQIQILN